MNHAGAPHGYRGGYWVGFLLLAVTVLRATILYRHLPQLLTALLLLAGYGLLYAVEPLLSPRLRAYRWLYFPVQVGLLLALATQRPFLDPAIGLFVPLAVQALHPFPRPVAVAWIGLFAVLTLATMILAEGWAEGIGLSLVNLGGGAFLISYDLLYGASRAEQEESQRLLAALQEAHQKLREATDRTEELAAARERNRLAGELHETVSQMIFGITLTARATRLLLKRDPARVPEQLDGLEQVTANAVAQLRSLIAQLRPTPKA